MAVWFSGYLPYKKNALNARVTWLVEEGDAGYFHRLLDAYAFKILPPEKQIATGFIDF
ncbi:hypothetical protein N9W89_03950 [Hellea sp.]|nr:hypothetical protein [Hellea sp.]